MKPGILLMVRELHHGGSERQLTETALGLLDTEFQAHVAAFRAEGIRADELRLAGIPILELPIRSFKSTAAITSLARLVDYVRANNIRLVHAFDMPVTAYAIPAVRLMTSAVALSSQRGDLWLAGPYLRRSVLFAHRRAHGILVNCEFLRHHLIHDARLPAERVHVCYNGVDLCRFRPMPSERPENLPAGSLVVGVVSVLRPEKGLCTLLEAFAAIRSGVPNLKLVVVGSGPLLPDLQQQAQRLGIVEACAFVPSTDRVDDWLRAMDVFVLPSLNEALSNSLLEAMACGCCSIASRVGGNPELIDDGVTGLIFESGDSADLAEKIRSVISNADLRRRLGIAAREFVHGRFSRATSVKRMTEIYGQLLGRQ